jgi:hypothetical protein
VSDSWLVIFPTDPEWLPDPGQEALATAAIARLVPTDIAEQPELTRTANVEFIHAGENFEAIRCPLCAEELDQVWWDGHMSEQYCAERGFRLKPIVAPCCGGTTTLNDLAYEWPLGFARWTAQVLYPERGWLTEEELREVELALEHPVRQTFRHI